MAYFAEIDENNKVLRVVVACDTDIIHNGGNLSEQASEYFKSRIPLSINGVKWIQTFSNGEFRKQKASINGDLHTSAGFSKNNDINTLDLDKKSYMFKQMYNR